MSKIYLEKRMGALVAADEVADDVLKKIPLNATICVDVSIPRNIRFHRKFWAMLHIIFKNQDHFKSLDTLLGACKLATGHADIIKTKHGLVGIPKSISFAKMDETEFSRFYEKAIAWVLSDVIPGLKRKELDTEVENELRRFAS